MYKISEKNGYVKCVAYYGLRIQNLREFLPYCSVRLDLCNCYATVR